MAKHSVKLLAYWIEQFGLEKGPVDPENFSATLIISVSRGHTAAIQRYAMVVCTVKWLAAEIARKRDSYFMAGSHLIMRRYDRSQLHMAVSSVLDRLDVNALPLSVTFERELMERLTR